MGFSSFVIFLNEFFFRSVHRGHKAPERTRKDTSKKTTQYGVQVTAAAIPSATFNFMTTREEGTESNDSGARQC